ncbi:MAG: hypothetical protein ABSA18_17495 [Dehalococcoidia bacterium]|jgi:hypothetical protein
MIKNKISQRNPFILVRTLAIVLASFAILILILLHFAIAINDNEYVGNIKGNAYTTGGTIKLYVSKDGEEIDYVQYSLKNISYQQKNQSYSSTGFASFFAANKFVTDKSFVITNTDDNGTVLIVGRIISSTEAAGTFNIVVNGIYDIGNMDWMAHY